MKDGQLAATHLLNLNLLSFKMDDAGFSADCISCCWDWGDSPLGVDADMVADACEGG